MKTKKPISLRAKIIFALVPIIIVILMEAAAHLYLQSKKIPDLQKHPEPPTVVSLEGEGSPDEERLRENYRILTTRPLPSLPFLKQDNIVFYHPKPEPDLSFTFMTPEGEVINYVFNSHGFRGDEFELEKTQGRTRIICAGDSSTFGYLVNIQDTYPALLEGMISTDTKEKNAEVINAGMVGYSSYQGLKYFETRLRSLEPDILIVSYGYNDSYAKQEPDAVATVEKTWVTETKKILNVFALYRLLDRWLFELKDEGSPEDRSARRVSLEEYRRNLEKIAAYCEEDGTRLLFVPISAPVPYAKVMRDVAAKNKAGFIDTEKVFGTIFDKIDKEGIKDYKGVPFGDPSRRPFTLEYLKRLGSEEMMRVRSTNHLFRDYCHTTAAANLMVAEEIFKYLIEQGIFTQTDSWAGGELVPL
jgi:lysophospholipase L1-like esterase